MNGDGQRQFVDTTVLTYAHDTTAGIKRELARALVEELWERESGCLSVQVLQEFYVTLTRKLACALTGDVAAQLVSSLAEWHIHSPQPDDILGAIDLRQRYQISFRDAMVIRSALRMGCDRIWSEELNPTQIYDGVQVVNPFS